jgi:hypothetical protein
VVGAVISMKNRAKTDRRTRRLIFFIITSKYARALRRVYFQLKFDTVSG